MIEPQVESLHLVLTTKASGLLPGDTPSLGHLLCRALGTWAMPGRYLNAAVEVMPTPVRPLVPHLTPSKAAQCTTTLPAVCAVLC